jgi:hypothetical protein
VVVVASILAVGLLVLAALASAVTAVKTALE